VNPGGSTAGHRWRSAKKKMKEAPKKSTMIIGAIIFAICSVIPNGEIGCLHQERLEFGLPLPAFSLDVQYGKPIPTHDFYGHGKVDKIIRVHFYWAFLPFSLGISLLLAAGAGIIGHGIRKTAASICKIRDARRQ
jgi:hypothetical protein